jgi:hypothetical protein
MESEVRLSHENELASNPEPSTSSGEIASNRESVRKKYSHLIRKLENVPKGKYMPRVIVIVLNFVVNQDILPKQ